jgi:hypothetical protein
VQEFHNRRLQPVAPAADVVDLDVGQTFSAVAPDELGITINLAPRQLAAIGYAQSGDSSLRVLRGAANTLKSTSAIKSDSSVNSSGMRKSGLSEPYRLHRRFVRHPGERVGQFDRQHVLNIWRIIASIRSVICCSSRTRFPRQSG